MFLISAFRNDSNGRMPKATYLLILCIAAAVAATLGYSAYLSTLPSRLLQVIEAADQIKIEVLLANIRPGRKNVAARAVETDAWSHYDRAENLVNFLLSNGKGTLSGMNTESFENELLLTREQISRCRQATERRLLVSGSPKQLADANRQIEIELSRLLSLADEIHVDARIAARATMAHFERLQYSLILVTIMLAFAAGAVFYRFDRRRAADYGTIRSQNQQLEATEQQLRASNQQLRASNQQLQAADQQLRASNQQLQASEQALRVSESRYRALFANMSEGMALYEVVCDEAGKAVDYRIEDVNRQFEEIFSVSAEKVAGRLASEAFEAGMPLNFDECGIVAETGQPLVFERFFPALDRDFRICVYSPQRGSCAAVFTDITDRKKAAEADRREAVRLEALMDIANFRASDVKELLDHALEKTLRILECGTGFICDYDQKAHSFRPRTFKTVRESTAPRELLGEGFAGVLNEAVQRDQTLVLNAFDAGAQAVDSQQGPNRVLVIPISRNGSPVAAACVADRETDFQEHDADEFALLMDSVWKIVELRQEQEERGRLETRVQKLESVGLLAGGIAHDFNNLLTAILANVSLARMQERENEAIGTRLDDIEKAGERAQDLTQQLLTFAKGGKPVKKLARLEPIIRDSASLAVSGTNVQCRFRLADDLCTADVDAGQLSQAISNLVINAVQAMPAGGKVTVEAGNTYLDPGCLIPLEPGRYVRISVKDKGIGILPEHLDRIFDPYFTTKQKGSGLGLTISHSVVTGHRGHITVDSQIGRGTSFHVYLPASCRDFSRPMPKKPTHADGRGSVLIMDDEEMVRKVCAEILKKLGYEVECVPDGREAVKRYEQRLKTGTSFDAVVLDLTVPGGMGGGEAVQNILSLDPKAKVLVSSGYANDPVMADYKSYGFCGLIPKPYTVQSLSEAVNIVVDGGKEGPGQYQQ